MEANLSTIKAWFKNKEDAQAAAVELGALGVDNMEIEEEGEETVIIAKFSGVTGVRNVFEKRGAHHIDEMMPGKEF